MKAAPAVLLDLTGAAEAAHWQGLARLLVSSSLAALLVWWWAHLQSNTHPLLASLVVAVAGGLTYRFMRHQPARGHLHWTGSAWQWMPARNGDLATPMRGQVRKRVDLGDWLWLEFRPDDVSKQPCGLAVGRRWHAPSWHALRCALESPGAGEAS